MSKITKDMIITDVLHMDSNTAPIFMKHGLNCLGCPASEMESIAEAGKVHGVDVENLINELNEYFNYRNEK
jgi:hybrid cluster-associated redox disulfide protein